VANRSEIGADLRGPSWLREVNQDLRARWRNQGWKGSGTGTERKGAGRVSSRVMMLRIVVAVMMMKRRLSARIAQNQVQPPIRRRQHEARRDECSQAKHQQHVRRCPTDHAAAASGCTLLLALHLNTMPQRPSCIK
jgi:hypothetical protein